MDFPLINASLNFISATLLVLGFIAIKKQQTGRHKNLMIAAFGTSTLFLASYLYYHYNYAHSECIAEGFVRTLYFIILVPHVILAAIMVPMILLTFFFAFRGQLPSHKKLAKITLPRYMDSPPGSYWFVETSPVCQDFLLCATAFLCQHRGSSSAHK